MKESRKYSYLLITGIINVVYFGVLDFWKYVIKGELLGRTGDMVDIILGIVLGIFAVLILAFSETGILVQLRYRKEYCTFKRTCFDNHMKIQILLLILYYSSSFLFSKMGSVNTYMLYLVLMPIFLAVALTRMSRTVWEKDGTILFMDVDGRLFHIDEICVEKDTIELICKSGEKKSIKKHVF